MFWKSVVLLSLAVFNLFGGPFAHASSLEREIQLGIEESTPLIQREGGVDVTHPEPAAYLQRVGMRVAKASDRPDLPYRFILIDNPEMNAWAVSGGTIGVNLGMVMNLKSEAELASVLAHEIGHVNARHSLIGERRDAIMCVMQGGINEILQNYWTHKGLLFGARLLDLSYMRGEEAEADALGIQYMARAGYNPEETLNVNRSYIDHFKEQPDTITSRLYASHPSDKERLAATEEVLKHLPQKGYTGKETYQAHLAPIIATIPAYEALQIGREALSNNDPEKALSQAEQGLSIDSRAPHLYILKARALLALNRPKEALTAINHALTIQPHFFASYLTRAQIYYALKQDSLAAQDEHHATTLLPGLKIKLSPNGNLQVLGSYFLDCWR